MTRNLTIIPALLALLLAGVTSTYADPVASSSPNVSTFTATCGTQTVTLTHSGNGNAAQVTSASGDGPLTTNSVLIGITYTFDGTSTPVHGDKTGVLGSGSLVTCTGDGLTTKKLGGASNPVTFEVLSKATP